jgi:hypothetical protein
MKRPARVPSQLPDSLHRRLNAYALTASAAGVGMLASAQPAEARIVYTAAHVDCTFICHLNVVNHNKRDNSFFLNFSSSATPSGGGNEAFFVNGYLNAVVGGRKRLNDRYFASALRAGVRVGNSNRELTGSHEMWNAGRAVGGVISSFSDPWANGGKGVKNRYLGLKFQLNGKVHYGWARLSVKRNLGYPAFETTLTGYAYETIPNKPIIAGHTHGRDEATLGHLATGASAIPAWRVKPTAATSH